MILVIQGGVDASGADVIDHAQRSLGPIYMVAGGRGKADTEDLDAADLRQLKAAKKSAIVAIGKGKFLERDMVLNRYLTAVPVDARDGVRRLEYIEWADELVETPKAAGGVA